MMQLKATVSLSQLAEVIQALSKEEREILEMKISGEEEVFKKRVREIKQNLKDPVLFEEIFCHPDFNQELHELETDMIQKIKEIYSGSAGNLEVQEENGEDEFKNVFILDFLCGKKRCQLFIVIHDQKTISLMAREEGFLGRL